MNKVEELTTRINENNNKGVELQNKANEYFKNVKKDSDYLLKCATFELHELDNHFRVLSMAIESKSFYPLEFYSYPLDGSDSCYYKMLISNDSLLNKIEDKSSIIPDLIKEDEKRGNIIILEKISLKDYNQKNTNICFLDFNNINCWHINLDNVPYFKLFIEKVIEYRANNGARKLSKDELTSLLIKTVNEYSILLEEKQKNKILTKF